MNSLTTLQNCVLLGVAVYVLRSLSGGLDHPMQSNITANTANKGTFSSGEVLSSNGSTASVRVFDRFGRESILRVTTPLSEGTAFTGGRTENGRLYAK